MDFILNLRTEDGAEIGSFDAYELYYQIVQIINDEMYECTADIANEIACFLNERGLTFDYEELTGFIDDELQDNEYM